MKRFVSAILFLFIVITGILSFQDNKVYACFCLDTEVKDKLERSAVVFKGKMILKGDELKEIQYGLARPYTFEIETVWKGDADKQVTVYGSAGMCGYQFENYQSYLVYAYRDKDNLLQTNFCSGNLPISTAKADLKQLGTGTVINKSFYNTFISELNSTRHLIMRSAAILSVVIILLFIWTRKQRNS